MKKIIILGIMPMILLALLLSSCKKIKYADVGESITLEKNLVGDWKLDSIVQVDQSAVEKGFPIGVQRLNLTNRFAYNTLKASFVADATGNAGTYTITNPGNAPLFIPASGNWSYFENGGPIRIKLEGAARTDSIDFAKAYRVSDNKLALRLNRRFYSNNKVFVYYDFNFSKQ